VRIDKIRASSNLILVKTEFSSSWFKFPLFNWPKAKLAIRIFTYLLIYGSYLMCKTASLAKGARAMNNQSNMRKTLAIGAMAATLTIFAAPSIAQVYQPYSPAPRRGPSLELYSGFNFTGERRIITQDNPDLRSINFDDAAHSLVANGDWEVCLDYNYAVRCRTYNSQIPNLESFRARISAVRYVGRGGQGGGYGGGFGGGYGGGYGGGQYVGQPSRGNASTFYPGTISGYRNDQNGANDFCRRQGHSVALFFGGDNRVNGRLEDVLCR